MNLFEITVKRSNKRDFARAVIDLEKRGFECIIPMKTVRKVILGEVHNKKRINDITKNTNGAKFGGCRGLENIEFYITRMRKVKVE